MKSQFSISTAVILILNVIASACLVLSILANYISPEMFWEPALFGLAFPYIFFVNLIFVFYWALRMRWLILISFIPALLSFTNIANTVQINLFVKEIPADEKDIHVISYNVRLFDLYNWTDNLKSRGEIFQMLAGESPDILCIQEFFTSPSRGFNNTDSLAKALAQNKAGKKYAYNFEIAKKLREDDYFGAATFTSYPIVGKGKLIFDTVSQNICTWTDLLIDADTVRVFNIHLQSIRFANEDYKFIKQIGTDKEQEELTGTLKILKRLKRGFVKRSRQSDIVHEYIKESPYPVILCGDFNDPPTSYTYTKISKNLMDAFKETGWGFAKTYAGSFPSFRIDFILHDKQFRASGYRTIKKVLSDHYPISCVLKKAGN